MKKVDINIHIPEEAWEPTGKSGGEDEDPRARLLATLIINGVSHHLEAFAVTVVNGIQEPHPRFEHEYEGMCQMSQPDGQYNTVTIAGREYVIGMSPFC